MPDTYLRQSSDLRAIYVDLNSIDIRAGTRSFVEESLYRLRLERSDIEELSCMVENGDVRIVFDGVDEMARPFSMAGRKEAFQLLRKNTKQYTMCTDRSTELFL